MKALSFEKLQDTILVDLGPERTEIILADFENYLDEENLLYHGIAEPDEYETPTGRWSIESYWQCAPEYMVLQHLTDFMQTLCLSF